MTRTAFASFAASFLLLFASVPGRAAEPPTRILFNGSILTVDANDRVAQAIAINGETIAAIGSDEEVKKLAGPQTQMLDLGGRTVIPGLNDAHIHAIRGGQTFQRETYWYDRTSLEAALGDLKMAAAARGPGKWVLVAGSWSPSQFAENRALTVADLNSALPDNPAYIQYLYDYAIVNAAGFAALGLDKADAAPPGIQIEKDAQGQPTGKLLGSIGGFSILVNKITASNEADRRESLAAFFKALNARGVTTIVDAAGGGTGAAIYDPLFSLWQEDKLSLRVAYRISAQTPGNEAAWFANATAYMPPRFGDAMLRSLGVGEIITFGSNDGVRLAPGFQLNEVGREELYKAAMLAARRKYPLEIHAYTNDAAKQILDVFERVAETVDLHPLRWCIAHISTGTAETFARMKKLGICYSVQMGPYYEAFLIAKTNGPGVGEATPPVKLALDAGLSVVGGTDSTRVGEYNTWRAIEYQFTGRAAGGSIQRRSDLALTRAQVLRLYTANGAWLTFDEDRRGTLEAGKLADLAVLDQPYLTMPADRIHTIKALLTMVGGKVVAASEAFAAVR